MDRTRRSLLVLLGVLAVSGCGDDEGSPGPGPEHGWVVLENSPDSVNGRHDDVFFVDPARGWLVNTRAELHRTADGGQSWELAGRIENTGLRCIGFASPLRGWVGNYNRTNDPEPDRSLFETADGGVTWTNVSERIRGAAVAGLCGLRVVSSTAVHAVGRWSGPAVFVKTNDAGATWRSIDLGILASGLVDLHFFDERRGIAVGSLGDGPTAEQQQARTVILATSDGGETWQTRYTSAGRGQRAWKVDFPTPQVGYVTTEGASPEGVVLKTTDGGLSWQPMLVAAGVSFEAAGFVRQQHGWVGSSESLYETADGGATWQRLDFGPNANRIRVLGPELVYASGRQVYRWTP